jgi:lysosomal acid lipase/cholesteryl ester hydrolase
VWIANCRGNSYSCRNMHHKSSDERFWDFSIDEMALVDVPAWIDHILRVTHAPKLTYVGFSQGTAVAFASLSALPEVESRVAHFIALAPACKAKGFQEGPLRTFVRIAPEVVYLVFGHTIMWPSVLFWRRILPVSLFVTSIDRACHYLFGWDMNGYGSDERKAELYRHIYSYTSVKTVVHWMQIVSAGEFQMFTDETRVLSEKYPTGVVPRYPVEQIRCPVSILYGARDDLTDIPWLLNKLRLQNKAICIPHMQHLELIWGADASTLVFPHVITHLKETSKRELQHPDERLRARIDEYLELLAQSRTQRRLSDSEQFGLHNVIPASDLDDVVSTRRDLEASDSHDGS